MGIAVPNVQRLPASHTIAGHVPLYLTSRPDDDPVQAPDLSPGSPVPRDWFDLRVPERNGDQGDADRGSPLVVEASIDAGRYADGRWYILVGGGWWRVDTRGPTRPDPGEVLGEVTPVPNPGALPVVQIGDLRVDDVMYASGKQWSPRGARVLDIASARDVTFIRTVIGWFAWRHPFAHVSAY